jgi:hypothetical protein
VSGLGGDVHTKRPVHLQVHETRRYQAIVVLVDVAGFEGLAAHARDAAPFEEDRALRPNLMLRDEATLERHALHGAGPLSRGAAGRLFGGALFDVRVGTGVGDAQEEEEP